MLERTTDTPFLPLANWHEYSIPNFMTFPKDKLKKFEGKFFSRMLQDPTSKFPLPLYTSEELAYILKDCFSSLLSEISSSTLRKHLLKGKGYAERFVYKSTGTSLRLFSKGFVRGFRFPTKTGYHLKYGYPRSRYKLLPINFISPYPPHTEYLSLITRNLSEDVSKGLLQPAEDKMLKVFHLEDDKEYTADGCYRLTYPDNPSKYSYVWLEAHTGTEGYDSRIFLKRIITAEHEMKGRGEFLIVVPFTTDIDKARTAIRKYNETKEVKNGAKPKIELKVTTIIDFRRLKHWKCRKGLLKHRTVV
ncbi:MAG: hypothetical protein ACTSQK_07515 [Candidatus Heimdallarchaeota archaeon]